MTCLLCRGQQFLIAWRGNRPEWWPCPACGGAGVDRLFCHPIVNNRKAKS